MSKHRVEVERRLVGRLLYRPDLIPAAERLLDGGRVFFNSVQRDLYRAIIAEHHERGTADHVAVLARLPEELQQSIGGLSGLATLGGQVDWSTEAHIAYDAEQILAMDRARRMRERVLAFDKSLRSGSDPDSAAQILGRELEELRKKAPSDPLRNVISADRLETREFNPVQWVIVDLLPEGLALLGGKPKTGKSRLALGLAVPIATGGHALGSIRVEPGSVLYLALEDSERRLQQRIRELVGAQSFPEHLHLVPLGGWPPLPTGGLHGIETWLEQHPDARLVIIDTLAKVRPPCAGRGEDAYLVDTQLLSPLLELAHKHRVCILVLTHTRKSGGFDGDWLETIHGSIGQAGAVDTVILLERPRTKSEGTLRLTGRDLPEDLELALVQDHLIGGWRLVGRAAEHRLTQDRRQVIALLQEAGKSLRPREVAPLLQKSVPATKSLLWEMSRSGLLASDGNGAYLPMTDNNQTNYNNLTNHDNQDNQDHPDSVGSGCPVVTVGMVSGGA